MRTLRFNQLSITSRVLISPITILFLLATVSAIALFSLKQIDRDVAAATTQIAPMTEQAQAISEYLSQQRILVLNYQQNPQPMMLDEFATREQAFSADLEKLSPYMSSAQQQQVLTQVQQLNQQYSDLFRDQLVGFMGQQQSLRENLESASRGTDRAIKKLVILANDSNQGELTVLVSELQANFQQARIFLHQYLTQRDDSLLAEAEFYLGEARAFQQQLNQPGLSDKLNYRINQLERSLDGIGLIINESRQLTQKRQKIQVDLDNISAAISIAASELNQSILTLLSDTSETVKTLTQKTRSGLITASAAAAVIGLLLAILISRNVRRILLQLNRRLTDISSGDGDLTARLPEQGGQELSLIARSFNQFMLKLQKLIQQLVNSTDSLASASGQLATNAQQSVANAQQQQVSVHTINQAISELVDQIAAIDHNARQASQVSQDTEGSALAGQDDIEQTHSALKNLSAQLNSCSQRVMGLSERTDNISEITDDIQGIADQTSLLALNAAIEAARAGEHGRGFAVVADEVRHLASRTHQMTEQIVSIIRDISDEVQQACSDMKLLQHQSDETLQLAGKTHQTLQNISQCALKTREQIASIADSSEQQTGQVRALQQQSSSLQQTLDEATQASEERAEASRILDSLSQDLQRMARQFRTE
ncbi:methyl-accepting chemotaxis protein [Oceanospirillum sp.]|uniref:methyl-accepting chemotaxis protein n=1 Tax=Oceanospirillum sp. TaxID=2021254 RepID=UPI003A8D776F